MENRESMDITVELPSSVKANAFSIKVNLMSCSEVDEDTTEFHITSVEWKTYNDEFQHDEYHQLWDVYIVAHDLWDCLKKVRKRITATEWDK